jgi:hypothetical protein
MVISLFFPPFHKFNHVTLFHLKILIISTSIYMVFIYEFWTFNKLMIYVICILLLAVF